MLASICVCICVYLHNMLNPVSLSDETGNFLVSLFPSHLLSFGNFSLVKIHFAFEISEFTYLLFRMRKSQKHWNLQMDT